MKATSGSIISFAFFFALLSLVTNSQAGPKNASASSITANEVIAAATDGEDDEEDEEEEAVDYRDRVREIQEWMNRRGSERRGDAPSLNVAPVAPPPVFPKYFQENGYDGNGYRKPDSDVRIKLHDAPEENYAPRYHRHFSWQKRWNRHVHPFIHARRHHFQHGYHHSYSRHSYSGEISKHSAGHTFNKGGRHESHAPRGHQRDPIGHGNKQTSKATHTQRSTKAQASHSKSGKKGQSRH